MPNSLYEGPRSMHPEEYDEVMDLSEKAYGVPRQYFLNQSHPDYQGKGYMGKLMNYATEKMQEREMPLAILGGYTQRYRHYGYERAGRRMVFHIISHSVKEVKAEKGFTLRGYNQKKDLEKIIEIHEKEPFRIKRSRQDYKNLLAKPQLQIWLGNERDFWVYAVLIDKEVIESGGEPSLIAQLFSYLLKHYPLGKLNLYLPCQDSQMTRTLYKISQEWEIMPLGMIKIVDLKKTLLSFRKQIENRAELYGIEKGNSITLKMRDSNQKATLLVKDGIEIKDEESSNILSLSDIEMVRLLFGPGVEEFGENKRQKRLLPALFPLNFYFWRLDGV